MSKLESLTINFIFALPFILQSQNPITIAESTFKINGIGKEKVYYGFCEGDQMIFDFEVLNGKALKEVEIIKYPGSSKFMDFKTSSVHSQTINVTTTGIFEFRFSNASIGKRICKYKIQRIPSSSESANFNSTVYNKTLYDTTYTIKKEKYLKSEKIVPVELISNNEYYINSGTNALFKGGKSRITIPINLPNNTINWYYEIVAFRDQRKMEEAKKNKKLIRKLSYLVDQTGTTDFAISLLTSAPGGNFCDIYLLDHANSQYFEAKQEFTYSTIGTSQNIASGISKIPGGSYLIKYLGIKNPDSYHGIHVFLQVVAITKQQEWAVREIKIPKITSKKVPFLKN